MLRRWILLSYLVVCLCQVAVDFELVRYNDETLTREQLVRAFESLGLQDPSMFHLRTMDLDAVLLEGQCQPGLIARTRHQTLFLIHHLVCLVARGSVLPNQAGTGRRTNAWRVSVWSASSPPTSPCGLSCCDPT